MSLQDDVSFPSVSVLVTWHSRHLCPFWNWACLGVEKWYRNFSILVPPLCIRHSLSFTLFLKFLLCVSALPRRNRIDPHFFSSCYALRVTSGGCTKGFEKLYFKVHMAICPRNIKSFLAKWKLLIIP